MELIWPGGTKLKIVNIYRKQKDKDNETRLLNLLNSLTSENIVIGNLNMPGCNYNLGTVAEKGELMKIMAVQGWI